MGLRAFLEHANGIQVTEICTRLQTNVQSRSILDQKLREVTPERWRTPLSLLRKRSFRNGSVRNIPSLQINKYQ